MKKEIKNNENKSNSLNLEKYKIQEFLDEINNIR